MPGNPRHTDPRHGDGATIASLRAALRAKEAELQTLLDVIPVGIGIAHDPRCEVIRINRYFAEFLGIDQNVNASKTAPRAEQPANFEVFYTDGRPIPGEQLPLQIAAREGRAVMDQELDVVHKDGRRVRLLEYASPLFDEDGRPRGAVGAFIDITHRQEAAEREGRHLAEIAHAGRLCTLGEMASGLAHEVNQPIGAARNYARACQQAILSVDGELGAKLRDWLGKIIDQTDRAAIIVSRLLGFVRRDSPRVPFDVNESVQNVLALTAPCLSVAPSDGAVSLSSQLAPDLPLIAADRVHFEQVLVNLVRNAIESANEARPAGGAQVVVETRRCGSMVRVDVVDNGGGVTPENQLKLFEPFFTTKANGVGLGLSISRSIVESHDGRMWAESTPGGGARFAFEMPIAALREVDRIQTSA